MDLASLRIVIDQLKVNLIRIDGTLERFCEHSIGHPVGHARGNHMSPREAKHVCDGCCKTWRKLQVLIKVGAGTDSGDSSGL